MVRRKGPANADPPAGQQLPMSFEAQAAPADGQPMLPHQLRPGDVFRDVAGAEWEVTHAPAVCRGGKRLTVQVRLLTAPRVERTENLAAHEKVTVRRPVAG